MTVKYSTERSKNDMQSFYLTQLEKKTTLYPNGQKLDIMQQFVRESERVEAKKRKKLLERLYELRGKKQGELL